MSPRLVLCPHGIAPYQRETCSELLVRCGGDLARVIDTPAGEAFLPHLIRLRSLLASGEPPLVLLTSLSPLLQRAVYLRARYQAALPELELADWLLFVDDNPLAFVAQALQAGKLDRTFAVPIWIAADGSRYLVVTAEATSNELGEALRHLREAALESRRDYPPSELRMRQDARRDDEDLHPYRKITFNPRRR